MRKRRLLLVDLGEDTDADFEQAMVFWDLQHLQADIRICFGYEMGLR
jgi:hypothetical protein